MSQVPSVIAYPINGNETASPSKLMDNNMDSNFLSLGLGPSNYGDDSSLDLGGNFFSQLDSMIQAVKVESTALDSMRDKLKEVDNLRNQINAFTKRLIDADQNNLNLKANLMKSQEAYNELKKQKAEMESTMVPLRQELNRTKEQLNKERMIRQQMSQEMMMIKEQYARLEQLRDNLDREVKTIPALTESNEILKNDLFQLRKRFKEEKTAMQKHIKVLENNNRDNDVLRSEVRSLAMRMMDLSSGNTTNNNTNGVVVNNNSNGNGNGNGNGGNGNNNSPMMMSYNNNIIPTGNNNGLGGIGGGYNPMQSSSIMSTSMNNLNAMNNNINYAMNNYNNSSNIEEEEEEEEDGINGIDEYHSFIEDMTSSSLDSLPVQQQTMMMSARGTGGVVAGSSTTAGGIKKKKIKKRVVTGVNNSTGRINNDNNNNNNGSNYNLPRIH